MLNTLRKCTEIGIAIDKGYIKLDAVDLLNHYEGERDDSTKS
jgi:hypothetical protein